nr:protein SLOW GREEN 1, chloroplastic-like [Ipomoea batatas]
MDAYTELAQLLSSAKPNLNSLPSLNNHRPVLARPLLSLSFTTPPPQHVPIKASSSFSPEFSVPKPAKQETLKSSPGILQTLTQSHFSCAVVTTVAAAVVFLGRFCLRADSAIAAPVSAPATADFDAVSNAETEKALQERLAANPNDIAALESLMESKIQRIKVNGSPDNITELKWSFPFMYLGSLSATSPFGVLYFSWTFDVQHLSENRTICTCCGRRTCGAAFCPSLRDYSTICLKSESVDGGPVNYDEAP